MNIYIYIHSKCSCIIHRHLHSVIRKIDYGDYPLKPPSNYKIYLDQINMVDIEFVEKEAVFVFKYKIQFYMRSFSNNLHYGYYFDS